LLHGEPHKCKKNEHGGSWASGFSCWVDPLKNCLSEGVARLCHEPGARPARAHENDMRERAAGFRCGLCGVRAEDGSIDIGEPLPFIVTRWVYPDRPEPK